MDVIDRTLHKILGTKHTIRRYGGKLPAPTPPPVSMYKSGGKKRHKILSDQEDDVTKLRMCPRCKGRGSITKNHITIECVDCGGEGYV